jgi:hypothetical protein
LPKLFINYPSFNYEYPNVYPQIFRTPKKPGHAVTHEFVVTQYIGKCIPQCRNLAQDTNELRLLINYVQCMLKKRQTNSRNTACCGIGLVHPTSGKRLGLVMHKIPNLSFHFVARKGVKLAIEIAYGTLYGYT